MTRKEAGWGVGGGRWVGIHDMEETEMLKIKIHDNCEL